MKGRIDLPGITLNTRIDGPSDAPWIVLSNSLGADLSMWQPQIAHLTRRYRVLRYDTRGHGLSSTPPGPYSFAVLIGDVIALLDHLGIESAAFMGLSMGGMTGLGLAIDHADRIERVVCADGRADAPPPFRAMWDERIARVSEGGLAAIADGTMATWLTETWRSAHPGEVDAVQDMILRNSPDGYIACCRALKELNFLPKLARANAPILYVGGSRDPGAPPEVMRAMAAATPDGHFVEIPDAAHLANINAPDAFNTAISPFLDLDSET